MEKSTEDVADIADAEDGGKKKSLTESRKHTLVFVVLLSRSFATMRADYLELCNVRDK